MKNRSLLIASCAIALSSSRLHAASTDWPQFRGPTGQGISTATDVPSEWDPVKNVAWKIEIPGKGWSSPVVADGKVYLTTAAAKDSGPVSLWAVCIDAASGKVLWDTNVFTPDPAAVKLIHPKNSPASSTPIVTKDRLFVHFGHLGTAALDLSGKIIWRENTIKYRPVHGNGGSPALINGLLLFTCDGERDPFVAALDSDTGKIKWTTPRNTSARKSFSFSTPLEIEVNGTSQAIIPGSGFVGGYDPATGHELWRVLYGEGYSVVPRPVFSHGLLFLSSGFDSPTTYAIKPAGATGNATATNVAWTQRKGAPLTPSMLVIGDELYSVSDGGIATCADALTGKMYWSHRFDGNFSGSPVTAEGRIYFQSEQGVGYVIKAGQMFEQISEDDLAERSLASDAVVDHALFIRTEHHLVKVAKQ
jgi:outer membrane protein assembly factor BamB